jgi:CsoR family transcriptional regulator, copper-sensing transcriptional repressor
LKTKGYPDIVQQVSAVRAALDGVTQVIIEDLVEYYISQITDSNEKNAAIELNDTVSRMLRLSVLTWYVSIGTRVPKP